MIYNNQWIEVFALLGAIIGLFIAWTMLTIFKKDLAGLIHESMRVPSSWGDAPRKQGMKTTHVSKAQLTEFERQLRIYLEPYAASKRNWTELQEVISELFERYLDGRESGIRAGGLESVRKLLQELSIEVPQQWTLDRIVR